MNSTEWFDLIDVALTALSVIGGSAAVAASPVGKWLKHVPKVKKVVDIVGMNVKNAKNKD